jgi:CheY-like chemotaxis protein
MAKKIVVLEDNADRVAVMRACIEDRFYMFDTQFFDEARDAIHFLDIHLSETLVIALDNDLEMKTGPDGRCFDVGEGRHVAEFLATKQPVCPVIIHTTNSDAGVTMEETLRGAGWRTRRIVPFDDMNWIESDWFSAIRRAIVGPIKRTRSGSRP